jgi:tetraacyldisaccharide 4'-kinase
MLLSPAAAVYGAAAWLRMQAPGRSAGVPVICIGNLTVGGGGKTPTALAVGRILLAAGQRPFFLSRGYGGRLAGPVVVNPRVHGAAEVGDEPLLLARLAATIVSRDRRAGAQAAQSGGAGVIVMDDGFQNPSLRKDLAILVIDGRRGIGNGRVIPAGPLRAPLQSQIARAHAMLFVGAAEKDNTIAAIGRRHGLALFHGRLEPDSQCLATLGGRKVLAFAGIADPEKFFATLTGAGIEVAVRKSFADHHRYAPADARTLLAEAKSQNLALVTTEKDVVRLAGDPQLAALAANAAALPIRLVVEEQQAFQDLVLEAAKRSGGQ